VGADRADPMPSKNERQGFLIQMRAAELQLGWQTATGARDDAAPGSV